MLRRHAIIAASAGLVFTLSHTPRANAKGLDQLKADENSDNDSDTQTTPPAKSNTDDGDAETKPSSTATETAKTAAEEPSKPAESAASKAIQNNLYLATSLGYTWISAAKGDWSSDGSSDLAIGYRLPGALVPLVDLYGTLRYAPLAATAVSAKHSYRGVIETYLVGGLGKYQIREGLNAVGAAELGFAKVHMTPIADVVTTSGLNDNGVEFMLSGGVDWTLLEKLTVGPKLYFGFGRFQTTQLAASAAFLF